MNRRDLLEAFEREEALVALAGEGYRDLVHREEMAALEWASRQTALRLPRAALPEWWARNQDPTQIDGRVLVSHRTEWRLHLQIPNGPAFEMRSSQILIGLRQGWLVEAT